MKNLRKLVSEILFTVIVSAKKKILVEQILTCHFHILLRQCFSYFHGFVESCYTTFLLMRAISDFMVIITQLYETTSGQFQTLMNFAPKHYFKTRRKSFM